MPTINITIKNKIATGDGQPVVCDNTDYTVRFAFDAEWLAEPAKTMRCVFSDGTFEEVPFVGNEAALPAVRGRVYMLVGVFAGNLRTTTPAWISCKQSIKSHGEEQAPPTQDVYDEIMELINTHFRTEVEANPSYEEDQPVLYGIEINGERYRVVGTEYYQHKCLMEADEGETNISAFLLTSSDDHLMREDFAALLNKGVMYFWLNGFVYDPDNDQSTPVTAVKADTNISGQIIGLRVFGEGVSRKFTFAQLEYFSDTITKV